MAQSENSKIPRRPTSLHVYESSEDSYGKLPAESGVVISQGNQNLVDETAPLGNVADVGHTADPRVGVRPTLAAASDERVSEENGGHLGNGVGGQIRGGTAASDSPCLRPASGGNTGDDLYIVPRATRHRQTTLNAAPLGNVSAVKTRLTLTTVDAASEGSVKKIITVNERLSKLKRTETESPKVEKKYKKTSSAKRAAKAASKMPVIVDPEQEPQNAHANNITLNNSQISNWCNMTSTQLEHSAESVQDSGPAAIIDPTLSSPQISALPVNHEVDASGTALTDELDNISLHGSVVSNTSMFSKPGDPSTSKEDKRWKKRVQEKRRAEQKKQMEKPSAVNDTREGNSTTIHEAREEDEAGDQAPPSKKPRYAMMAQRALELFIQRKDDERLSEIDMAFLRMHMNQAVLRETGEVSLQFASFHAVHGRMRCQPMDQSTMEWAYQTLCSVPKPSESHPGFTVLRANELPKQTVITMYIDGAIDNALDAIRQLKRQNPEMPIERMHRYSFPKVRGGHILVMGVEQSEMKWIADHEFKVYLGMGMAPIRVRQDGEDEKAEDLETD